MAITRLVGKYARIYLDAYQLYLRSYEATINAEITTAEATVYGDDWKRYDLIDAAGSFEVTARLDSAVSDIGESGNKTMHEIQWEQLTAALANSTKLLSFIPAGGYAGSILGDTAYFGEFKTATASISQPRGDIASVNFRFLVEKRLWKGRVIDAGTFTESANYSGTKTAMDAGGAATGGACLIHVYSKSAGAAVGFRWMHDADDLGGGEGLAHDFTNITAVGAMYREDTATSLNTYYQITTDTTSAETVSFLAVGARNKLP